MNRVIDSSKISIQTVSSIGLAIYHHGGHIGIAYRIAKGAKVEVLHLGGHLDLKSELPTSGYSCWIRPAIHSDRAEAIAALCRRIWKQNKNARVAYGFSQHGQFFKSSGEQRKIKGPSAIGLTCASFVLEVFDQAKLPLVDSSWPPASDQDKLRQQELLADLRVNHPDEKEHLDAVEKEIGNIRYTPLQVAGAATSDNLPVNYTYANAMATAVGALLQAMKEEYRRGRIGGPRTAN